MYEAFPIECTFLFLCGSTWHRAMPCHFSWNSVADYVSQIGNTKNGTADFCYAIAIDFTGESHEKSSFLNLLVAVTHLLSMLILRRL